MLLLLKDMFLSKNLPASQRHLSSIGEQAAVISKIFEGEYRIIPISVRWQLS